MKKITKNFVSFVIVLAFAFSMFAVATTVNAGSDVENTLWGGYADNIQNTMGVGNEDPRTIAANIINIILGFLGILAVVLILFGGFKWMTAAGNEDKVSEARKLLVAGVTGLIIILAAYSLAAFVLEAIFKAVGS